jgi:hypothetical protein
MKAKTILFLVGLVVLYLVIGIDCSQSPGSDRIADLENKVLLLTDRISALEESSKLIIWSGYSTQQIAVANYTPNVVEFSTADDFVGPMDIEGMTILKSGYYHLKFFQSFRVDQTYRIRHGELSASLWVNHTLLVRAPFHIGISLLNGMSLGGTTGWEDEVNGTITPYSLEGTLSGVIHIDKVIYFSAGERFYIRLPHSIPEPFIFYLQPGENGLQIRYLGQLET